MKKKKLEQTNVAVIYLIYSVNYNLIVYIMNKKFSLDLQDLQITGVSAIKSVRAATPVEETSKDFFFLKLSKTPGPKSDPINRILLFFFCYLLSFFL